MKLATLRTGSGEIGAIITAAGLLPLSTVNEILGTDWPEDIHGLLHTGQLMIMKEWFGNSGEKEIEEILRKEEKSGEVIGTGNAKYAPLYRDPPKIWGIGLNYRDHAEDLSERPPAEIPASFMKPSTTIIGFGDTIRIPTQSERTTGEAELGVIIGKRCKDVEREDWLDVVAGFTCIIDMTAEDILKQNPRYLTLSKSFDTFFSFGPQLIIPDEIHDIRNLTVSTIINGNIHASNTISNMTFPPNELVSFHSRIMTLLPGDIISTGTPRAIPLSHGDIIRCEIDGFMPLENPVIDMKCANFQ